VGKDQKQKRQRPKQDLWQKVLAALLKYRKRHGNCRVPTHWAKNPWLGNWVERIRAAKKQNLLTKSQIQELDKIGFIWSIDTQQAWEQRVKELKAFKKKHGHYNVPKNYPPNRQLAGWVSRIRWKKRHGRLAREKIRLLNTLSFCWDMSKARNRVGSPK
jgi:hypothetical protein